MMKQLKINEKVMVEGKPFIVKYQGVTPWIILQPAFRVKSS